MNVKELLQICTNSVAQKMVVAKLNMEVLEGYLPTMNQEQRNVYNNIFSLVDDSCTESAQPFA